MDLGLLYETPFGDRSPDGPEGVSEDTKVEKFVEKVRFISQSAVAAPAATGS